MTYLCLSNERKIFVKETSVEAIGRVARVIFDFDGVLVHTTDSFRQAIRSVVDYYFLEILRLEGERGELITLRDIQRFKDTGLYNNDWKLSHVIITYFLVIAMRRLQKKRVLRVFAKEFNCIKFSELPSFLKTLSAVGDFLKRSGISVTQLAKMKSDRLLGLRAFLMQGKVENQDSFESILEFAFQKLGDGDVELARKLVPFDFEKPDLLKRLFEEKYLGKELFSRFYGEPSVFKFDESLLEKERIIPSKKVFDALRSRVGKFAIYSEKPRAQGTFLLKKNNVKGYFDEELSFFQEDLTKPDGSKLGKPDPTFFIRLVENLSASHREIAYVGDSIADAFMVKNARLKGVSNILFFGVLCSSQSSDNLLSQYIRHEADAIMTDVNDIQYLFTNLEK